jgi:hypothetical protein
MGELVAEAHAKTEHIGFWSGKRTVPLVPQPLCSRTYHYRFHPYNAKLIVNSMPVRGSNFPVRT